MIAPEIEGLLDQLAPLSPSLRDDALGRVPAALADEARSLLRALDLSPTFLDRPVLNLDDPRDDVGVEGLAWPRPGARLGGYTIVREIARGGMGVVYEAEQDRPRRRVALKVMKPGPHSPADLARFRREAESLGRLNHPGIATILDARMITPDGAAESTPYIAMEFIRGRAITDHARDAGLGARDIVRLMADACDAVAHAHAAGIIHRDLSPSNLMVDERGAVKVVDFGVAAMTGADLTASLATTGRQVFGKWATMSPEQATGEPSRVDARTDVFSLGAVLYELLAGRPWLDAKGKSVVQLARTVGNEDPVPIGRRCREADRDLQAVVATAMHKERARRYQSASALRDELLRWLRREAVHAREPGALERLGRFSAQNRAMVGAVAAAIAALAIGMAVATAQWIRARDTEMRLRHAVRSVLDQVVSALSRTRYALDVRAGALEEVRPAVEQLLAASPADPGVRSLASKYYTETALVEGYFYTPNRGNTSRAIEFLGRAVAVAAPLGLDHVEDEECAAAALRAWNLLEEMLWYSNRLEEGDGQVAGAIVATEKWLRRGTDPDQWLNLHMLSIKNGATRLSMTGRGDEVPPMLAGVRERLLSMEGAGAPAVESGSLGGAWLTLAIAANRSGRFEGVPDNCARARPLIERWLESPGADPDRWLDYLDTFRQESLSLASLGRSADAAEASARAVAVARGLVGRFPQRQNMHIGLMLSLIEQGESYSAVGDLRSIEAIEEAQKVVESLAPESGSPWQHQGRVAVAKAQLARAAIALYRSGLTHDLLGRELLSIARSSAAEAEQICAGLEPSRAVDQVHTLLAPVRSDMP